MNLFSDKACHPRHVAQYLFSTLGAGTPDKGVQDSQVKPLSKDYSFELYQTVADLPNSWTDLVQNRNSFLDRPFLTALEKSPPKGVQNRYVLLKWKNRAVGVVLLQLIEYRLKETLKGLGDHEVRSWRQQLRYSLAAVLNFRIMVIGNLLLSGEHAFLFEEELLTRSQGMDLILQSLPQIRSQIEAENGQRLSGVMIKDLASPLLPSQRKSLMHQVTFQPSMKLSLRREWKSKEGYLADLQSKYRVRARRAFKKAKDIQVREWSLDEIEGKKTQLHSLYKAVADNATFNMLHLEEDYLPSLKQELGTGFRLFGYENKAGEFLGFCTLMQNGEAYDAHFLGLDDKANKAHQLYLNMLFNMLGEAIQRTDIKSIVFGRTALEIKSSIGAVPQDMYCYIKHFNSVFNLVIGWLIRKYDPVEEWQARHPFKASSLNATADL
ncbi:MAG: hypothetical protein KTR30_26555 [Saprospiraceae bacterium]|nr:hypothetical protein [Saprospiraceae bacterium]